MITPKEVLCGAFLFMPLNPFNPNGHNCDRFFFVASVPLQMSLYEVSIHFPQKWKPERVSVKYVKCQMCSVICHMVRAAYVLVAP